jgi:hypothetical protein
MLDLAEVCKYLNGECSNEQILEHANELKEVFTMNLRTASLVHATSRNQSTRCNIRKIIALFAALSDCMSLLDSSMEGRNKSVVELRKGMGSGSMRRDYTRSVLIIDILKREMLREPVTERHYSLLSEILVDEKIDSACDHICTVHSAMTFV